MCEPYVPRPQRGPSVRAGLFRKDEFSYDQTCDSFLCPAGQRLHPYSSSLMRGLKKINYRNSQACRDCPIRSQCTGNQFRSVSRLGNEAVLDRMQARWKLISTLQCFDELVPAAEDAVLTLERRRAGRRHAPRSLAASIFVQHQRSGRTRAASLSQRLFSVVGILPRMPAPREKRQPGPH